VLPDQRTYVCEIVQSLLWSELGVVVTGLERFFIGFAQTWRAISAEFSGECHVRSLSSVPPGDRIMMSDAGSTPASTAACFGTKPARSPRVLGLHAVE
jgi:hypothetical protein